MMLALPVAIGFVVSSLVTRRRLAFALAAGQAPAVLLIAAWALDGLFSVELCALVFGAALLGSLMGLGLAWLARLTRKRLA